MGKNLKFYYWTGLLCAAIVLNGCMKNPDIYQGGEEDIEIKKEDFFDFKTTGKSTLNVNYGLTDYPILYYVYDENPFDVNDEWKGIEPIYASSTDEKGYDTANLTLPAHQKELWLYTNYIGATPLVKLVRGSNGFEFNQKTQLSKIARGVARAEHSAPDGYTLFGDWDTAGTPDYLSTPEKLSTPLVTTISNLYIQYGERTILKRYPEFANTGNLDTHLQEETEISVVFLKSGASLKNTLGYYAYPTGEDDSPEANKRVIIFPNVSNPNPTNPNALTCQLVENESTVKLKYWNGTSFQDKFPAGTSIGWFLIPQGFSDTSNIITGKAPIRYSNNKYNSDGRQRVVSLLDAKTYSYVALGFEDQREESADFDYKDAVFAFKVSNNKTIDPDDMPTMPDVGQNEISYSNKGSFAFEDNWPKIGDYDMNDAVINYNFQRIIKTNSNKTEIVRIVDRFTLAHNGARNTNGFAYELPFEASLINEVTMTCDGVSQPAVVEGNVVIVTDNVNGNIGKTYIVTVTLKKPYLENDALSLDDYNPFIFVNERTYEVHLPTYKPTDKADTSLFGTEQDLTDATKGMYYISKDNMPFAIHIPGQYFAWPGESIRIYDKYPDFKSWRESKGKENADWYTKPIN